MNTACMQAEVAMHNTHTHIYVKNYLYVATYIEYIRIIITLQYTYVCIYAIMIMAINMISLLNSRKKIVSLLVKL